LEPQPVVRVAAGFLIENADRRRGILPARRIGRERGAVPARASEALRTAARLGRWPPRDAAPASARQWPGVAARRRSLDRLQLFNQDRTFPGFDAIVLPPSSRRQFLHERSPCCHSSSTTAAATGAAMPRSMSSSRRRP